MANFTILGPLAAERAAAALPPEYRERVRMVIEPEAIHTVALFAHARGDVVTAAPVRRALARIGADALSLAAGADFKREAEALLTARRVSIVRFGEAGWTDTSVVALRP